jgi:hypothetical protein
VTKSKDTFFYPSNAEDKYFAELSALTKKWPHDIRHYMDLFSVYASRRSFIRLMAHYELFKQTTTLPGHYVDFGIYYGKSFFTWHKFLEVLTPTATHKKVIGFDTFSGFSKMTAHDGREDSNIEKHSGGLSSDSFLEEFSALLHMHNRDAVIPSNRGSYVKGDIAKTLPDWLKENPEARFCLVNIDVDLYEPTKLILEKCWDRIVQGGVLILDEYATPGWPGEGKAWDEFARERGIKSPLRRFEFANAPAAYVIKEN